MKKANLVTRVLLVLQKLANLLLILSNLNHAVDTALTTRYYSAPQMFSYEVARNKKDVSAARLRNI